MHLCTLPCELSFAGQCLGWVTNLGIAVKMTTIVRGPGVLLASVAWLFWDAFQLLCHTNFE